MEPIDPAHTNPFLELRLDEMDKRLSLHNAMIADHSAQIAALGREVYNKEAK